MCPLFFVVGSNMPIKRMRIVIVVRNTHFVTLARDGVILRSGGRVLAQRISTNES